MSKAVFGIVPSAERAGEVVQRLHARGIASEDISVLFADRTQTKTFADAHSTAREGAATGASHGSVVGGALGVLAGLGALVVPGLGIFIAAGPLMVLFGAMAGAAIGGIGGALRGAGLPASHADWYEEKISEGHVLLAVHARSMPGIVAAKEVLIHAGAEEVFATVEPERDYTRGPSRT